MAIRCQYRYFWLSGRNNFWRTFEWIFQGKNLYTISIALFSGDLVAILSAFGWGTFAAASVLTIAIGLAWKLATTRAACIAIISSLVMNLSLKVFNVTIPFDFAPGAVALMVSLTLFFGISLLSELPRIDADVDGCIS